MVSLEQKYIERKAVVALDLDARKKLNKKMIGMMMTIKMCILAFILEDFFL